MNVHFLDLLTDKGITYNPKKNEWVDNGKVTPEENILIFLIRALKALNCKNAGEKAESILEFAKTSPETTFKHFLKTDMRKEYGTRTSGKEFFLRWLELVEPTFMESITGLNDHDVGIWLRGKSGLLKRFYEAASAAGINIKNIARIGITGIFRHVFVGWKLVRYHRTKKQDHHQDHQEPDHQEPEPEKKAWDKYEEFIRKLFSGQR